MKIQILFVLSSIILSLTACGSSKKTGYTNKSKGGSYNKIEAIVKNAQSYLGTQYRTGGTTKKGMDCSGLVYTAFTNNGVSLHRTSYDMSKQGRPINTNKVQKGDLLFFKTSKSGRSINHVGVVSKVKQGDIYFIHSTTSKGVIESTLATKYWTKSFKFAKRIF